MKKPIKLLVVLAMILSVVFASGCSKGNSTNEQKSPLSSQPTTKKETETTVKPTEKATEKPTEEATEVPTEKPTEKTTEASKPKEYTAEELLKKTVPEILEIFNDDIIVEYNGPHSHFGSSTGSLCFYNFDILPGFVFCPKGATEDIASHQESITDSDLSVIKHSIIVYHYEDLQFVAMMNDAKMNDEISAGMTYNEISTVTGNYATSPPAGQGLITQNLTDFCKGATNASITYETSNEAMKHMSNDGYDSDYLKQENPKAMYIIAYR